MKRLLLSALVGEDEDRAAEALAVVKRVMAENPEIEERILELVNEAALDGLLYDEPFAYPRDEAGCRPDVLVPPSRLARRGQDGN